MPLFFVLSGFVIHYNYSRLFLNHRHGWAIATFTAARFARLYPLFLCAYAVGVAVDAMLPWLNGNEFNLALVLGHALTLTQSWFYIVIFGDRTIIDAAFGLSWSISTEMFFYLIFVVFIFSLTALHRPRDVAWALLGLSVLAFGVLVLSEYNRSSIENFGRTYMNDHFSSFDHSFYRWLFYYSPYVRLFEFVLGCLTSQLYLLMAGRAVSARERALGGVIEAVALSILVAYGIIYGFQLLDGRAQAYFNFLSLNYGPAVPIAAVIFCVSRYQTPLVQLLSCSQAVMLGELSYSIYVVHTWTLRIFVRPPQNYSPDIAWEAIYRIALGIAVTLVVSSATYRLIEDPARKTLRRIANSGISRLSGPTEDNELVQNKEIHKTSAMLKVAFMIFLGAILTFQFAVVPIFARYTNG